MKIRFLGGADEVGASCTLVEIAGKRLLIDAGIRISPRSSRGIDSSQLPDLQPITEAGGPDYILVTHAHTDHTGALPLVAEQYPQVPVLMTRPTLALVRTLQKDAQHIMKSRQEEEGELPLFDQVAVDTLLDSVQEVAFNQAIRLGDGLQVTFYVSGHIAGAAMLAIESEEGTLVMSGDVSKSAQRTVESVKVPPLKADVLVLESTYGGRLHANRSAEEKRLIETLARVIERGGKVLIPAFALGRAQEILQIILAYQDQIKAPVYADGMVRSVCDSYARFADLLPQQTVRAARLEHLFFRDNVKPVRNTVHRNEIASSPTALIVVASSGMLTGGASTFYAQHFATDERNAILLTGYQDEEAPGRFLQRIMREKQAGTTPMLKINKTSVPVHCEIDTYALSAHADEQELVNIALALKADEVMLVHGDAAARHSLATALRRRQIITSMPKINTVREFSFAKRPWALGAQIQPGTQQSAVDLAQLWASLREQADNFFSARELAQMWWGDADRAAEMQSSLYRNENIYFEADWRNRNTFRVQSESQVKRTQKQREIMLAHPDLVGKLIVLRNSNDQARLAVVRSADIESFEADVEGSRGTQHPADALVWILGNWQGFGEGSTRAQLKALHQAARSITDQVFPFEQRQALLSDQKTIRPETLLPDPLPESVDAITALTAITLTLAQDGAIVEEDGLRVQRALEHGPLEQNDARNVAMSLFPSEARLRKVGMEVPRKRMTLTFDFPQQAMLSYAEQLRRLSEMTGWDVEVRQQVNQQALSELAASILPAGVRITKGPSFFLDRNEVHIEISGLDNTTELETRYREISRFRLVINPKNNQAPSPQTIHDNPGEKMEINEAYATIKEALMPYGLYKTSLKQGQIILSFISPQLGERHADIIADLQQKTGYMIGIHPHPNQQQILLIARQLFENAGWQIRKGPGIHIDRACISISLHENPEPEIYASVLEALVDQTGYTLELN